MSGQLFDTLPVEIFHKIFSYMPVWQIVQFREVCVRWKDVIDDLMECERFWKARCVVDFSETYQMAISKCDPGMTWHEIYRSLALWCQLRIAWESREELCSIEVLKEEIRGFQLISGTEIGVHTRSGIVYYKLDEQVTKDTKPVRESITGDFVKYSENDKAIAVLSPYHFLFVKKNDSKDCSEKATFKEVKTFLLLSDILYYIDIKDDLYECKLDQPSLQSELLVHSSCDIVSVGVRYNQLYILTIDQGVYAVTDKTLTLVTTLESCTNLLHVLHAFNFLEMMDWRTFFHWMFVLKHEIPLGPLESILITHIYGDVVIVGCNWGLLRIYYRPYIQGELDIFECEPKRKYNLMQWFSNNMHCMYPILSIAAREIKDGHHIIVGMPKKIVILKFNHDYEKLKSIYLRDLAASAVNTEGANGVDTEGAGGVDPEGASGVSGVDPEGASGISGFDPEGASGISGFDPEGASGISGFDLEGAGGISGVDPEGASGISGVDPEVASGVSGVEPVGASGVDTLTSGVPMEI